ncbi:MAG: GMC family oxidoreductase [Candidatus Eisenbacteria bacterium]|uniref:GMC family oxidoreductase n=1 Tax=Eiseniibacteriota bacterium TaxID=2212470 RepID=A0A849SIF7_UNCEI|nr:GMC family oxidoreductase [Candidatus Eisenbacteria bacterium]
MSAANHYDVIIIGTGAGGGTLAWALAPTGKKVLLLERGDYARRETENWSTKSVVLEGRYNNAEKWRDAKGHEFQPGQHYFVGGNTKFFGAALLRMREQDFGVVQHAGGVSPAWPVAYADLEPYYTQAERLYSVHGTRGEDPTEPWASAPYSHPAVSHEPRIQRLHDGLVSQGYRPFHVPLGIRLDESNWRKSACVRCATCDGHPCLVNAKADAQVTCVDPALAHGNVTLLTGALATKLETSADGRTVTGVVVEREGRIENYSAELVISAAGAINSAALLLRSANDRHPNGLANSSDQVGRNYMCHLNSVMMQITKCANPTVFQKTWAMNDFYWGTKDWQHPMGHVSFVGKLDENTLRAGAPKFAPGVVLDQMAKHSLDFWLTSEDLPAADNRVTVERDGQIRLSYTPNNEESHRRLTHELQGALKRVPCDVHGVECHKELVPMQAYIGKRIPLAGVAHQNGTVRFGADPKASVLDVNCKAHDLDNLYVVDGGFFPSSSAVNPALTIMANALRVANHLKARLGVGKAATAMIGGAV